jgi:serine/threonine-protein kinase RsbW
MIRLRVPGALKYRDLAVRAVAAACKLVGSGEGHSSGPLRVNREFDDQVVSAFGEAFNNAALHSYRGRTPGDVEIEMEVGLESIVIRMIDYGNSFDIGHVPEPDLDSLPESGLGIFIIKSFMDEVEYKAGAPNILCMKKRLSKEAQ